MNRDDNLPEKRFDGEYLARQLAAAKSRPHDSRLVTLVEISQATGCPEDSLSAPLEELRKAGFESCDVWGLTTRDGRLFGYAILGAYLPEQLLIPGVIDTSADMTHATPCVGGQARPHRRRTTKKNRE